MTETTAGATIETTATGHPSAPILAREAGVNPVDYMRSRGFVYDISDEEGLRALFDRGEPVTLYQGFDPTGPSLHAGHMVGIMMLGSMQRLGHRPIALGGGGTAMVGDPSGRTSARELIREEDLASNIAAITAQLGRYLDYEGGRFGVNPAAISLNNADWLLDLKYIPFLRDIGRHFSVNEMLAAETYKVRLETTGLNFVEFNYRLVQAYDFLHLYRKQGCMLQLGGSDQWGNIVAGVDLVRRADQGKAFALVCPLITTATGEKMGKTGTGVRVWLDPELFSPYEYYQYWVNTDDRMVETYLKMFTFLPSEVIADLTSVQGEALREAKRVLALEATALAHGIDAARQAEEASKTLFGGGQQVSADDASLPTVTIPAGEVTDDFTIADAFVAAGLAKGRGEARRLAGQGGLRAGEEKIADVDQPFATLLDDDNAVILRAGKKRFQRVVIEQDRG
jgi:tyrosyl-tRNA synthetase